MYREYCDMLGAHAVADLADSRSHRLAHDSVAIDPYGQEIRRCGHLWHIADGATWDPQGYSF